VSSKRAVSGAAISAKAIDHIKVYHVNALPTVYVIDQNRKVVDSSHALDIPTIVNRLVHGK
jgi:hypothetical protein